MKINAFQEAPGLYQEQITALLEIDLNRIFTDCGLTDIKIDYTNSGLYALYTLALSKKARFFRSGF